MGRKWRKKAYDKAVEPKKKIVIKVPRMKPETKLSVVLKVGKPSGAVVSIGAVPMRMASEVKASFRKEKPTGAIVTLPPTKLTMESQVKAALEIQAKPPAYVGFVAAMKMKPKFTSEMSKK